MQLSELRGFNENKNLERVELRLISLFNNAGFSDSFSAAYGCDRNLRNAIMCSYRDQFIQEWHSNLMREYSLSGEGGNKLRTYRTFKKNFLLEPYLVNVTRTSFRVSITRLRIGCHSREIEVGRYHKPKRLSVSERLCRTCNVIEDEKHFLCVCLRYGNLRSDLLTKIQNHFPGFTHFSSDQQVYLMESAKK